MSNVQKKSEWKNKHEKDKQAALNINKGHSYQRSCMSCHTDEYSEWKKDGCGKYESFYNERITYIHTYLYMANNFYYLIYYGSQSSFRACL